RERRLIVEPDSHCQLREVNGLVPSVIQERGAARWKTASTEHYNRELQFKSQSLIVALTERPTLGGRAWRSLVLAEDDTSFAFSLWSNSTLGLLCHWWMANKSQAGRGTTTPTAIPLIPTLDILRLSHAQRQAAKDIFKDLKKERFLPFDQI